MPKNKIEHKESENIKKQKLETTGNRITNDSQAPTTSKAINIDPNITTTTLVDSQEPTSNKNLLKQEQNPDNKPKEEFYFWQKINKQTEIQNPVRVENIKINELYEGKIKGKELQIRISYKSEIRNVSSGLLLTFHGMDDTGEIAFVIFGKNNMHYSDSIKINNIYSVENFVVYAENPEYRSGTGNNFQARINTDSIIKLLPKTTNIPHIKFNFRKINEIQQITKNEHIDCVGIIVENNGLQTTNRGTFFRDLILTDDTKTQITITIWGTHAEDFPHEKYTTTIVRNGTIVEFLGKNKTNCLSNALVWCNPEDNEEAKNLTNWFKNEISDVPKEQL